MASPSVLAMLLTTKYVDGLPLHRFEKVLSRHGVDSDKHIDRQEKSLPILAQLKSWLSSRR
jgi:hypothetical protein